MYSFPHYVLVCSQKLFANFFGVNGLVDSSYSLKLIFECKMLVTFICGTFDNTPILDWGFISAGKYGHTICLSLFKPNLFPCTRLRYQINVVLE